MSSESDKLIEKLEDLWKNDSLFENLFSLKGFTFWPDLKNSFTKICNERFLESVSRILLFKEFLSSSNISTILLWSEPSQEEQELISLAKTKKINLVYLQHAMAAIEDAFYPAGKLISHLGHNSQCDKHAVWGEPAKQYALSYDSKKQIFVTGSPRHDNFFNNKNSLNQENYILFATTRPNPLFSKTRTTNSISAFSNFIVETCRVFSNLPEKKLVIKPHPSPVSNLDVMTLAKKIDSNISFTYDSDVMKIIEKCEFLITTNNSTIALEAMMLNKPVISLQTESLALTENIAKSNAIISVSNIDDIEIAIKKLIYDKDFKNQLLKNAKIFLDEFFSYQGKSSKNFIHQIELE